MFLAAGLRVGRIGSAPLVRTTLLLLVATLTARAQTPALPDPASPADVSRTVGELVASSGTGMAEAPDDARVGFEPFAPRVEMSLLGTIADSLFGDVYGVTPRNGKNRTLRVGKGGGKKTCLAARAGHIERGLAHAARFSRARFAREVKEEVRGLAAEDAARA